MTFNHDPSYIGPIDTSDFMYNYKVVDDGSYYLMLMNPQMIRKN